MQVYVHNLNYNFHARVDSVVVLNERGVGYFYGHIAGGKYDRYVEDSLNHHLINYKRIRFLNFIDDNRFWIFIGGASNCQPLDSMIVNSDLDVFNIYREGQIIRQSKVSGSATHKVFFAFWLRD